MEKTLRICEKGHRYYKSSDCPTCPQCENDKKPENGFLSLISAPARRALENNNIKTLNDLAGFSEDEILRFHGVGKNAVSKLTTALHENGLQFKNQKIDSDQLDITVRIATSKKYTSGKNEENMDRLEKELKNVVKT